MFLHNYATCSTNCTNASRPLRVKGGCGRQADGTAGLPPAPEIPRAARHLRFVPKPDFAVIFAIESREVRAIGLARQPVDGDTLAGNYRRSDLIENRRLPMSFLLSRKRPTCHFFV
jgi:hypothetical protein